MDKITVDSEFFNIKDTLDCGQIFRYTPQNEGYRVFSAEYACDVTEENGKVSIYSDAPSYFENYFDLKRDYSLIFSSAKGVGNEFLLKSAESGKGIRILKQDAEEMIFSFIISQNNNIPRIKGIIERLCNALGREKTFNGKTYRTFPKATDIAQKSEDFYKSIGLGYRAGYFPAVADALLNGFDIEALKTLATSDLKKELLKLKGVGPKVADCIALFGFYRTDSFPVDTWIEKLYREDYGGTLTDRNAICEFFTTQFKENAGFFQQYMFHYKRNVQ